MIKNNLRKMILTTIVILLPILVGIVLWNKLPETVATHWGFGGVANGFSSKLFAVLGLPLFLVAIHWLCAWATGFDPKIKEHNPKMVNLVLWICPCISILCGFIIYYSALGKKLNIDLIMMLTMGIMFIIIGNYLPKCKQSYTIGIKLPWTLESEENWNKTHRLGGRVWVVCGVVLIFAAFLPTAVIPYIIIPVLIISVLIPIIYSYLIYKKTK